MEQLHRQVLIRDGRIRQVPAQSGLHRAGAAEASAAASNRAAQAAQDLETKRQRECQQLSHRHQRPQSIGYSWQEDQWLENIAKVFEQRFHRQTRATRRAACQIT